MSEKRIKHAGKCVAFFARLPKKDKRRYSLAKPPLFLWLKAYLSVCSVSKNATPCTAARSAALVLVHGVA